MGKVKEKPVYDEFAEEREEIIDSKPEYAEIINNLSSEIENLNAQIKELQKKQDGVSKGVLMDIATNINVTADFIGKADRQAQEIIDKEDDLRNAIQQLESQNRLDQATHIRDLALLKFYKFFDKIISHHELLRNELNQLQGRIRNA